MGQKQPSETRFARIHYVHQMIESWFPTLVYQELLDYNSNQILIDKAYSIQKQSPAVHTDWRCDTYNTVSNYNFFDDSVLIDLIDRVSEHVKIFATLYGATKHNVVCKDAWFNIASPGSYQEYHNHAGRHFSAVYYISTPVNSGRIVFKSTDTLVDMFPLPLTLEEQNVPASWKTCHYTPVEKKLIIFRSNLQHMVEKNLSNSDRITIAMNFNLERADGNI